MKVWFIRWGAAALAFGAAACAGEGGDFTSIEDTVVGTCASCHATDAADQLVADVAALDDGLFTEARFPASMFDASLVSLTSEDLRMNPRWPGDENIPAGAPDPKAWILSELHELQADLQKDPSSVFTTQEDFDEYNTSPPDALFPQGCETLDRLDAAAEGATDQMPPLYTEPLFELLQIDYVELTSDAREEMREYILGTLPEGASTCLFL